MSKYKRSNGKEVNIGRNELHMEFCQEARRSNMAGFHVTRKKNSKHDRRRYKIKLRKNIKEDGD